MEYYEWKKKSNLVFTLHNFDPSLPYQGMKPEGRCESVINLYGPSYWSHLSGRYRTALEQKEFVDRGCIDVKLGRKRE